MGIMEVCCDMSSAMEWTLSVLFPNAKIVSDRFHVMKNLLDDIWAIRTRSKTAIKKRINEDQKRHKASLKNCNNEDIKPWRWRPTTKIPLKRNSNWETDIDIVTRIVWQIRKRRRDWNQNQKIRWTIAKWILEMKDLIEWYEYMHKLREIFDETETKEEWQQKISQWIADWLNLRKIDEIDNLINTVDNRFETICNYFISRHSNWFAEWLHSRIQRLISMSRWFVNKDYMIYRIIKLCKSGIKFH
jgi:transposase